MNDSSHDLEIVQARDYYIVQHNDLVQTQQYILKNVGKAMSATEEKLLAYIISQIKPNAETLEPITLDIKTFCAVCGLARGKNDNCYTFIKSVLNKMLDRHGWLFNRKTEKETSVRFIDKAIMSKREGKVQIILDEDLEPYLIKLYGNYFQFRFHNILAMKSKYGIRLYKLLKSYYHEYRRLKFSIDDLKMNLDATGYKEFKRFKEKVLTPALRDINTYSDLEVTAEFIKSGRNYTHIVFTMKDLEKAKNPEAIEEAQRRYLNVEREINPDQLVIDGFLGGMLE